MVWWCTIIRPVSKNHNLQLHVVYYMDIDTTGITGWMIYLCSQTAKSFTLLFFIFVVSHELNIMNVTNWPTKVINVLIPLESYKHDNWYRYKVLWYRGCGTRSQALSLSNYPRSHCIVRKGRVQPIKGRRSLRFPCLFLSRLIKNTAFGNRWLAFILSSYLEVV